MLQPGCPWQVALQIVTVITGDADHNLLTGRFGDAVEGVKGVLLQRLHLLESFLSQASEWSRTYSASPCGSHTTAAALAGRNAPASSSRHRRRHAARSTSPPVGRRSLMWKWCELMRMMLPPLRPVSSDLGLPTQVQDFLALLPDLVLTLLQSCLSLECTVTPKLNLRLIARRFRGFHHAAWRWCWRLPRSSAGTGSWWHSNGPTSSVRGLSR